MTDNFLRQRRNIFIINGILLFCYLAKVEISKLTLAGISFEGFGNPAIIYHFLWVIMSYFCYRFVVYFLEDEREVWSGLWARELTYSVDKKLKKIAFSNHIDVNEASISSYYQMKSNNWILHYQAEIDPRPSGSERMDNFELPISHIKVLLSQGVGVIRFGLVTPALTNYVLPILMSICVFYIAGFSSWEGSFLVLFS